MEADAGQDHAVWVSDDQPDQGARDVAPAGPGRPRHSSADMTYRRVVVPLRKLVE